MGNKLTNVFIPKPGYFIAALGIFKILWEKWVRWLLPLLLAWLALGIAAVIICLNYSFCAVLIDIAAGPAIDYRHNEICNHDHIADF